MCSLGMESVFIGDVVDGVSDVGFRVDVGEATADDKTLVLLAGVQQLGGLLMSLAVGELITVLIPVDADIVQWCFFYDYRLTVIVGGRKRGSRKSDSDDNSKGNNLK